MGPAHVAALPTSAPAAEPAGPPLGVVALNLGGPDSLEAVEPFLRRLLGDPEVVKLGLLRPLQPLLARFIARRRAPVSRQAYQQIGGRSPIAQESAAQAAAVAAELRRRGVAASGYVAMACWHPFSEEAVRDMQAHGVRRAVALPLYPHFARATTGSSLALLGRAVARGGGIELAQVERYPDAPGYIEALAARLEEAAQGLPEAHRQSAPVLFSAHGLPVSFIEAGDTYLDEIRLTVAEVTRRLELTSRARLSFQSRLGQQRWLGPSTEEALEEIAESGAPAVIVVPVAFTGEHLETLQEIDIVYKQQAQRAGIAHFARARTVGLHPAFIGALADLVQAAARSRGW